MVFSAFFGGFGHSVTGKTSNVLCLALKRDDGQLAGEVFAIGQIAVLMIPFLGDGGPRASICAASRLLSI